LVVLLVTLSNIHLIVKVSIELDMAPASERVLQVEKSILAVDEDQLLLSLPAPGGLAQV
jgi:hypothetical protein